MHRKRVFDLTKPLKVSLTNVRQNILLKNLFFCNRTWNLGIVKEYTNHTGLYENVNGSAISHTKARFDMKPSWSAATENVFCAKGSACIFVENNVHI